MNKYNEIYQNIVQKCAKPMEEMRKIARNYNILVFFFCFALGLLLSYLTTQLFSMCFAVVLAILIVCFSKKNREYKKFFKENVITTFVKSYSENLDYVPFSGVTSSEYSEGEFEQYYDNFYSEDLITGTLDNGYKIKMSEVHTQDESTDSDGNTTYTTLFHGLYAKIVFDKYVNTNMKIRKNSISIFGNKDKLEMDSSDFEKKFNVYSTDKIIAMQLLTADIMQMLIDFIETNKVTPEITLKNNNMYIRFATGEMFEASFLKNSLDFDQLKKYYDTINFTLEITEKFLKNIAETEL